MEAPQTRHILVIYASRYGQTAEIANHMGELIQARGLHATVANVRTLPELFLENYECVIIGSPVYIGQTDHELQSWVHRNLHELGQKKTAFFTVSLNAADEREPAKKANLEILENFLRKTGLKPDKAANFIGALMYREYNPFIRFIMKRISASEGGPTDTSHNHELTRWPDVEDFIGECLRDWFGIPSIQKRAQNEPKSFRSIDL